MGWFSVVTEREVSVARNGRSDCFLHPGQTVVKVRKQKEVERPSFRNVRPLQTDVKFRFHFRVERDALGEVPRPRLAPRKVITGVNIFKPRSLAIEQTPMLTH
jgi:hypothetical protein